MRLALCRDPRTLPARPSPGRLRVSVLGPVRAWLGDRELSLGAPRQRTLFALLATAAGRAVSREELIDGLWGVSPPATAAGNVYTYVSGLRRAIAEPGVLTSGPAGYALRLHPRDLDSEWFIDLCAEAGRLARAGDPAGAAIRYDTALALWHGEAYAGLPGPRAELERAGLAERRLTALVERARVALERGDDDVVAELAGLVREYPLHEPLHELLVRALHHAGRRTEALDVYRVFRRRLHDDLGVEPGRALEEQHEHVRADLAGPAPVSAEPLVGRDAEVSRLRGLVAALADGRGSAVWIEGEPGSGKSALLATALTEARSHGCRLLEGSADRYDGKALLAEIEEACAAGPLVVAADDLQAAGERSLLLWDRLVAATGRMPLLLIAAVRPDPGRPELAQLRRGVRARRGHVLSLTALPPPAVEELVGRVVGGRVGRHLAAVAARSGGNPLIAREMASALKRQGALRTTGGIVDLDLSVRVEPPPALLAAVQETLRPLPDDVREVLRAAALLGDRFAVGRLVAATGRSPFELTAHLETAIAAHLVVEDGPALRFRHPFLRAALTSDRRRYG